MFARPDRDNGALSESYLIPSSHGFTQMVAQPPALLSLSSWSDSQLGVRGALKIIFQSPAFLFSVWFRSWAASQNCMYFFNFNFLKCILFPAALGLHCCMWLSLAAMRRGYSSLWSSAASHCGGFSRWGPQLWSTESVVLVPGLSCPTANGIFLDQGAKPCPLHRQVYS